MLYDSDWSGAETSFPKATQINPEYTYSILLVVMKRFDEAIAEAKRDFDADPLSPPMGFNYGIVLFIPEGTSSPLMFSKS